MTNSEDNVGWIWNDKTYYCAAHKPSAPDDEQCVAVIASDYNGEVCNACGHTYRQRMTKTAYENILHRIFDQFSGGQEVADVMLTSFSLAFLTNIAASTLFSAGKCNGALADAVRYQINQLDEHGQLDIEE